MLAVLIPENEAARQTALDEREIVDTEAEASFDALTRLPTRPMLRFPLGVGATCV